MSTQNFPTQRSVQHPSLHSGRPDEVAASFPKSATSYRSLYSWRDLTLKIAMLLPPEAGPYDGLAEEKSHEGNFPLFAGASCGPPKQSVQ